ncbi:VOC family protein [Actinacidiphila yeochonensis]|uniref:VOC family protein n=1 Tax=Actinacidiphila yeochonensis TaxID=89050 RepID=UPI000567134D|nr:VOC family protein [Actinacidiphila yeochonensis]
MTDKLWLRDPDSSRRKEPRVLIRVFVAPGGLEEAIGFYERLQGTSADMLMPYPEMDLRLAAVGAFLVIEGDEDSLRPFRATTGTLLVDDVEPYYERLLAEGAQVVAPPQRVPVGANFTVRHPDGTVVEYVHHRPERA